MSYAVFRIEGIKTTNDLRGIGKHNKDRVSKTNEDIDKERSADNIELISLNDKTYNERFDEIVKPYREEHEERMKTVRKDRVKSFSRHINDSRSDVATEFLFTSDTEFFKDKSKKDIERWAKESLEFVTEEIGIKKENIIHAVVHMDEKTPHLHVVGVPLIKAYDGRRKKDVWQISRRKFIPDRESLIDLQDKYHERMVKVGFDLKRGEKGSKQKHETPQEFKARQQLEEEIQSKLEEKEKLENELKELREATDHTKQVEQVEFKEKGLFGEKEVVLKRSDFDSILNDAKASKALKIENKAIYNKNAQLEKLNYNLTKENQELKAENKVLKQENKFLNRTLELVKTYFKDQVKEIGRVIGLFKANVLDKMGMDMFKKYFASEEEIEGAEHFIRSKQNAEKQKEQEKGKENELEL